MNSNYNNSGYRNNNNNNYYQDRGYQDRNYSNQKDNSCSVPLKEPYYSQVLSKVKTIEGRINSGQFKEIRVGQKITFCNQNSRSSQKEAKCEVIGKRIYKSFDEMLKIEGLNKCLPNAKTLDEGICIYNSLPGFKERAQRSGVVALEIALIEDKKIEIKEPKDLRNKIEIKRSRDDQDEKIADEDQRSFKKLKREPLEKPAVTLPTIHSSRDNERKIITLDDLGSISKKRCSKDNK